MVNSPVIARRELNTYFLSLLAYVVLTLFALASGLVFAVGFQGSRIDPTMFASWTFQWTVTLMIWAVPMIAMRLLSEEAASGTIETLLTTPVSSTEVVLGKYVGALIFSMAMLVPVALECAYLTVVGDLDYGRVASGFLGVYLATAQFLAVGLLCSSLTRVQLAAAVMTLVTLLGLLFLGGMAGDSMSTTGRVLRYVAPTAHLSALLKGVVDSRDLVYFVATTCMVLFLTVKVLDLKRGR